MLPLLVGLFAGPLGAEEVLVWQEEFNGPGLDKGKWTPEVGFVRNERAAQIYRADRLSVRGGALHITAIHAARGFKNPYLEKGDRPTWQSTRPQAQYASGSVNSLGKFSMRYGRVEIRAKFNVASGAWPALWMLGTLQSAPPPGDPIATWKAFMATPWPNCGEIDILEYATRDDNPAAAATDRRKVYATFHWGNNWAGPGYLHTGKTLQVEDLDQAAFAKAAWHRYGMNWTPERITLTCDDRPVISLPTAEMQNPGSGKSPFRENYFHFILNLALGGMANPPPANGKGYPMTFAIDYVRVWQNPEVAGSGLRIKDREWCFDHLTAREASTQLLMPADAKRTKQGALVIGRSPAVLGAFSPTRAFTLTLDATLPARATGTLLGLCAGEEASIRLVRRSATAYAFVPVQAGKAGPRRAPFAIAPGRHRLEVAYSSTGGTRLSVDGEELFHDETLHFASPEAAVRFITLGGGPTERTPSPLRGLVVHKLELK